jgi:hypothetical protein
MCSHAFAACFAFYAVGAGLGLKIAFLYYRHIAVIMQVISAYFGGCDKSAGRRLLGITSREGVFTSRLPFAPVRGLPFLDKYDIIF